MVKFFKLLGAQLCIDRIEKFFFGNVLLASFSFVRTCLGKGSHDIQMIIAVGFTVRHSPPASSRSVISMVLSAA
jgi:hypothetical protein